MLLLTKCRPHGTIRKTVEVGNVEIILLLALMIVMLLLLSVIRRKEIKPPPSPQPQPALDDEVKKLREELAQRLQAVQEKEADLSEQLVYENYVEGQLSHLLAIAIQGVIKENSPTVSAVEKALGPRNNYRQSTKYLDYMLQAGIVTENSFGTRTIAITPGQARCIIIPKLMEYPADWGVSQVVEQLTHDVIVMLSDFWTGVDTMSGIEFEAWCMDLLRKAGFEDVQPTKASGDQGVDILAVKDEVPYAFQCKCYASDLGNTPVQEVYAGLRFYHRNVGVVITNRYFTQGAQDLAAACDVLLWDRDRLKRMVAAIKKQGT